MCENQNPTPKEKMDSVGIQNALYWGIWQGSE